VHVAHGPHWHWPLAEQRSASSGSHAVQVTPAAPQVARESAVQVTPMQQPSAQDTASHTHAPARQRCPRTHVAPPPHWQAPFGEQPSALVGSQALQTAPPVPQAVGERTLQVEPEQQPPAQVVALHPLQAPPRQS
jgi:hypothetical protein